MPLANTSMPVPSLAPMGAWNVALQHMGRASAELAGQPAGAPIDVPAAGADLALANVGRVNLVDQLVGLKSSGTLPLVHVSHASSDVTAAVRVLQAATPGSEGDRWSFANAKTAVDLLAQASGKLAVAPTADSIDAARGLIGRAADAYGLE